MVPGPVLTEVCSMAESRLGSETEARFLDSLAPGEFELEAVSVADLRRMASLVRTYADFPLGAADASVVAVAERLGATRIATLDHRHFRALRPALRRLRIAANHLTPSPGWERAVAARPEDRSGYSRCRCLSASSRSTSWNARATAPTENRSRLIEVRGAGRR